MTARLRISLLALASALALLAALPASSPAAEAPRWQLTSTTTPTNLTPGAPADEVQQLTVDATGGAFRLTATTPNCSHNEETIPIAFDATAPDVQAALEALTCAIPSGSVAVTGGPGATNPYTVTFQGEPLGARPIPLVSPDDSALTGAAATATVTELTKGQHTPELVLTATNVGAAATDGSTIEIEDALPAPLTATAILGYDAYRSGFAASTGGGAALSCSAPPLLRCTTSERIDPGDVLVLAIKLAVPASGLPTSVENHAAVSGGGAPSASVVNPIQLTDTPAPFGPAPGTAFAALSSTQAGAHPNLTTAFTLATSDTNELPGLLGDVRFDLPPGLVSTAVATPRCPIASIVREPENPNGCPPDTMVGTAVITLSEGAEINGGHSTAIVAPVSNVAPAPGEPAAFAFNAFFFPIKIDTGLLSDGDYGGRASIIGIPEAAETLATSVTIWGVPADHSGPGEDISLYNLLGGGSFGGPNPGQERLPLLTNPQQCSAPLFAEMSADSWANPGVFAASGLLPMGTLTGCDALSLSSSFSLLPSTPEAAAPAGYKLNLQVPQRNEAGTLATPTIHKVTTKLPPGTVLSPSAASGLASCSDTQFFGTERPTQQPAKPAACPPASKIGTVTAQTPALLEPLTGQVFLAEPRCGPCTPQQAGDGQMLRLFIQFVDEGEPGIVVKLEGHSQIDQHTGQLTTVFDQNPPLPFSELEFSLNKGPRAALSNPRFCGPVSSSIDLEPWSTPQTPNSITTSGFEINQGCFASRFSPSFAAGTAALQAGAYTPFELSFGRSDQDQFLHSISVTTPPGLLAKIAGIPLCREPQASQGTCGQASLIGHVQAFAGPGPQPFQIPGGQVFLTDGYKGAPYGLSAVVPAKAGPYTLAGTNGNGAVVVRSAIAVDPADVHLTVTSDPLPTMLDGIPLQVRRVDVQVDRPGFTFNPTNCEPKSVAAEIGSAEGLSAVLSSRFQVGECAALGFKPKLAIKLRGATKRTGHPALTATLTYPSKGAYANIARAQVTLPSNELLDNAHIGTVCSNTQFAAGAGDGEQCPPASIYGHARATTPLLDQPLEGPVYLRTPGHRLPDLVAVLNGQINVELRGKVDTGKGGGIRTTFEAAPDAPVTKFTLEMQGGKKGLLQNSEDLCAGGAKRRVIANFTAQNGRVADLRPLVTSSCAKHPKHGKGSHHG